MCFVYSKRLLLGSVLRLGRTVRAVELEQLQRVGATDLRAVDLRDRAGVEPSGGVVDVLERPVGREQDVIRADLQTWRRSGSECGNCPDVVM